MGIFASKHIIFENERATIGTSYKNTKFVPKRVAPANRFLRVVYKMVDGCIHYRIILKYNEPLDWFFCCIGENWNNHRHVEWQTDTILRYNLPKDISDDYIETNATKLPNHFYVKIIDEYGRVVVCEDIVELFEFSQ